MTTLRELFEAENLVLVRKRSGLQLLDWPASAMRADARVYLLLPARLSRWRARQRESFE
jgi:hypothetical protein